MAHFRRKREETSYNYECIITAKTFKRTAKAKNPEALVSLEAFYQLNPDRDDRPLLVKKRLGVETTSAATIKADEVTEKE